MLLYITGFATGTLLTVYLLLGVNRSQRENPSDSAEEHAEKWRHQRPLPPF